MDIKDISIIFYDHQIPKINSLTYNNVELINCKSKLLKINLPKI